VARLGHALLALALIFAVTGARAEEKWGLVFLHGKQSEPGKSASGLLGAIEEAGYLVETPELCWSAKRIYDRSYLDCLDEIGAALAKDRERGAAKIVLGGIDTGANAAIGYAARHRDIVAVLAISPSHSPERLATVPEIGASLAVARALAISGRGNERVELSDVNLGRRDPEFTVKTTPRIYLSWFGPDSPALMPVNIVSVAAPIFWLAASDDPNQHGIAYAFARAPKHPLNRYTTLDSDQIQLPIIGTDDVLAWLRDVRAADAR